MWVELQPESSCLMRGKCLGTKRNMAHKTHTLYELQTWPKTFLDLLHQKCVSSEVHWIQCQVDYSAQMQTCYSQSPSCNFGVYINILPAVKKKGQNMSHWCIGEICTGGSFQPGSLSPRDLDPSTYKHHHTKIGLTLRLPCVDRSCLLQNLA